ncbi:MAG: VTT domain-containing protein [Vicinamibacterales bacterium]
MEQFIAWLQPIVERFGGVGMAILAAIDCSFVSMPNLSDVLIVWQTIQHPDRWLYYALMTTAGSVAGSLVIYEIGRRSGERFLLRRFKPEYVAQVRTLFARYGMWVIAVIALLPPPAPYKIFVLLAGVGGVGPGAFALAVLIGRGLRYGIEGWLARVYGPAAADLMKDNVTAVSLWLIGGTLALVLVAFLWQRRVQRRPAA